jgi:hypothetical protein
MTTTPTMEQERPVTFAERELADKGQELARMVLRRTGLVDAKKAENSKRQAEIDELDEEIAEFAQSISDGFENRKQGDLFHDQTLPKDEAAKKLIKIAAWSAKHPFVADSTRIDACAHVVLDAEGHAMGEACGKQQGDDAHVPPQPSAPHKFVGDGSGTDKCWACGSGVGDEIHAEPSGMECIHGKAAEASCEECNKDLSAEPARDPNVPHPAEVGEQPEGQPKACLFCTRAIDDPIHAPAIAETIDCSRCGKHVPKAEVLYDSGIKPVCETCKRAGIEAGTWPHPFRKGHEKAHRCADCMQRQEDAVHVDDPPPAAAEPVREVAYTPEEMEREAASDPAASPDFDPALDDVETPAEGGGAGA